MADIIDIAGGPGECEECGEESPRLVDRLCARCRERIAEARRRNGRGGRIGLQRRYGALAGDPGASPGVRVRNPAKSR